MSVLANFFLTVVTFLLLIVAVAYGAWWTALTLFVVLLLELVVWAKMDKDI